MSFIDEVYQRPVIGTFSKITDPAVAEIAGYAGLDFIIIDLEHGPGSIEQSQNLIRAAEKAGSFPVIRVDENSEKKILRALDIGAKGVQVPGINNREQAEKLVEYSYYSPVGARGVCRYVRAAEYTNLEKEEYFLKSNEEIITIAHIEGEEGINNLDDILTVENLDILFIGPYDLSQSLGIPGEVDSPKLLRKMEEVVDKSIEKNKIVGTFVETPESAKRWINAGVHYIAYSVDVGLLYDKFISIKKRCLN